MGGLVGALSTRQPERALVIGLGTGSTAGWLGAVPTMERVDVVELEPAVLRSPQACAPVNHDVSQPESPHPIGDAREVLLATRDRYDVIFSEPSNPYRAGVASLFTREFYRAGASRLAPGGLFLQWLQAYEVDAQTVRTVYATLASVFPEVETWPTRRGDLILMASPSSSSPTRRRCAARRVARSPTAPRWRGSGASTDLEGRPRALRGGAELAARRIAELEGDAIATPTTATCSSSASRARSVAGSTSAQRSSGRPPSRGPRTAPSSAAVTSTGRASRSGAQRRTRSTRRSPAARTRSRRRRGRAWRPFGRTGSASTAAPSAPGALSLASPRRSTSSAPWLVRSPRPRTRRRSRTPSGFAPSSRVKPTSSSRSCASVRRGGPTRRSRSRPRSRGLGFAQYLKEGYMSYLAPIGKGLQIDAGKFVTPAGAEVIETNQNWNYSRSLLFYYAIPYYHFGVRTKYTFNDKWSVSGYAVNGWNNIVNNTGGANGIVSLGWTPNKKVTLTENYLFGPNVNIPAFVATPAVPAVPVSTSWRNLSDTVFAYNPTAKLSLVANFDYGQQSKVGPTNQSEYWTGVAAYVKYAVNPNVAMAARYEYYNDHYGFTTGTAQHLNEITGTIERKIAGHLISRLEYRHDGSNQNFFQRGIPSFVKGQTTVDAGLVFVLEPSDTK